MGQHSMKMMWGCAVIIVLAVILAATGVSAAVLFVIPCVLMMGAMMWMMLRMGHGSGHHNR